MQFSSKRSPSLRPTLMKTALSMVLATGIFASQSALAQTPVTTQHNNNSRTGANRSETRLKPTNVTQDTFGLLFTQPVDGYVVAQPLILPNLPIPGKGRHNVVYVVTEHNSVYAYDADSNTGGAADPYWHVNLGASVPWWETGSQDIDVEIGITSTPVIDNVSKTLYVVAKTKETDGTYAQRLHALDVTTGAERTNSPVLIQASVPGIGDGNINGIVYLDPLRHMNRVGLLLQNGVVYIGFGSHGDNIPYHGWVIGYDTKTLVQTFVHCTSPNAVTDPSGYPIGAGGIWMSGGGLAGTSNSIYFLVGNGSFDANKVDSNGNPGIDYGDSFVKLDTKKKAVVDYFTPFNQNDLNNWDADLGSGGLVLLPASVGSTAHPRLLVGAGKQGTIYLLDRLNMGKFNSSDDSQIVQSLPNAVGGTWSKPAYYNGNIYYQGAGDSLKAFSISNGQLSGPTSQSGNYFTYPGATPSISANGSKYGIAWVIENGGTSLLHAYDASDVSKQLYSSGLSDSRDTIGNYVKFTVPTIANGKVFVGTQSGISVFGNGKWVATPVIAPDGGSYSPPLAVTITDATPGAEVHYTLDGTTPTEASPLYTAPLSLTTCATVQAMAFKIGLSHSGIAVQNYLVDNGPGKGSGLSGAYYNSLDLSGTALTRIDPTIDFDWSNSAPFAGVNLNNFSVRWTGSVQPRCSGDYTFYANADDGVRLWVNGKQLVDAWIYQGATEYSGTVTLQAGTKYSIKIEYFQGYGGAIMQLKWSGLGIPKQIVPSTQLFPAIGI